jgi:large subunit ribosomal protein L6
MSRIGKKPIVIPSGVKVEKTASVLKVSGTKGNLEVALHPQVNITVSEKEVLVDIANKEAKKERALWGLYRSLIYNMVEGVTKGFEKKLEVNGVGFKVAAQAGKLVMSLGFSHPVEVVIPKDLQVAVEKNVITITGADKRRAWAFARHSRKTRSN